MDELRDKHRAEQKDLKARIQSMKNSVNSSDKKKKKDIAAETTALQEQLDQRQATEVRALSDPGRAVDQMKGLHISENSTDGFKYEVRDLSKTQRKKEKKKQAERERDERIRQEDVSHLSESSRKEAQKLALVLTGRRLKIHEIPSDGDCMYNSIKHQLSIRGTDVTVDELRNKAADFMRNHRDLFQPFMSTSTAELMSDYEFETYCASVAKSKDWGGHLELRALSESLGHRVQVLQADGPVIELGSEFDEKSVLLLSYHRHAYSMGEHYNSLIPN